MRKLYGSSGILTRKGLSGYRVLSSLTFAFTCGKLNLGIITVGICKWVKTVQGGRVFMPLIPSVKEVLNLS